MVHQPRPLRPTMILVLLGLTVGVLVVQAQPPALPDPTRLPATLITSPNTTTYNALNVASLAPGGTYVDPVTKVTVVKLTTRTAPISGTSVLQASTDYGSSGNRIGRPTNGVYPIVVGRFAGAGPTFSVHILKFNLTTHAVTYHGAAPGGQRETQRSFSYVTPNIFYTVDHNAGTIRKWDVTSTTATEVTGGVWPKTGLPLHGAPYFGHFQISADDRWFAMKAETTDWLVAWDSQTNIVYDRQFTGDGGLDELKLDKEGGYISVLMSNALRRWAIVGADVDQVTGGSIPYSGHSDALRRYAFGTDGDYSQGFWRTDLRPATSTFTYPTPVRNIYSLYTSGNWVDQTADLSQWALVANQPYMGGNIGDEYSRRGALVLYKLDASDARLLAHSYGVGDLGGDHYYTDSIWPNMSPDGRFCLFKSNMGTSGSFGAQFAAILPTTTATGFPSAPTNLRVTP